MSKLPKQEPLTEKLRRRRRDHEAQIKEWGLLPLRDIHEPAFNAFLGGSLLDPSAAGYVLDALLAGGAWEVIGLELAVDPIDLVVRLRHRHDKKVQKTVYIEVKGFTAKSHQPGWEGDPCAMWQTDLIHSLHSGYKTCEVCGFDRLCSDPRCPSCWACFRNGHPKLRTAPTWLPPRRADDQFIVLDLRSRYSMEDVFPHGVCNEAWALVPFEAFLHSVRTVYEETRAGALSPLLAAAYADKSIVV